MLSMPRTISIAVRATRAMASFKRVSIRRRSTSCKSALNRTYSTFRSLVQKRTAASPSRRVSTTLVSRLALIELETVLASKATGAPRSYSGIAVDRQIDAGRIERHARVAGGRDDAAPVGIGAGDGRLHQRAVGDGPGDLAGVFPRLAAANVERDQVRGPFAVVGNRLASSMQSSFSAA